MQINLENVIIATRTSRQMVCEAKFSDRDISSFGHSSFRLDISTVQRFNVRHIFTDCKFPYGYALCRQIRLDTDCAVISKPGLYKQMYRRGGLTCDPVKDQYYYKHLVI